MNTEQVQTQDTPSSSPELALTRTKGKHLTQREIALALSMHGLDKPNSEIARVLGVHEATVGRLIDRFADSRDLARKRLEGGALKLAQTVVNTKDSTVALKALGKLDVVREDAAGAGNNVVVVMGNNDRPLDPPVIDVQTFAISPSLSPDHE